jgi:hypothetical protein
MTQRPTNHIGGRGTFSVHMTERVVGDCLALGIGRTLISAGGVDNNQATTANTQPLKLPQGRYIGTRPEDSRETYGYLADPERAATQRQRRAATELSSVMGYVQRVRELNLTSPFALEFFSVSSGHRDPFREMVEQRQQQLPEEIRLGCFPLPHETYLREAIHLDPAWAVRLKDDGLLEASVMVDNRSPIAATYGRTFQDALVARSLAALMAAVWHFPNQRSAADATHALARYCSLIGLAFGLRPLVAHPEITWWPLVRRPLQWEAKGHGSLDDVIAQAKAAVTDALTDTAWRSVEEPIHPQKQAFVTICVPLKAGDRRWRDLAPAVELWLEQTYPYVTPLWIVGNGVARPDLTRVSSYWVLATLFYPMTDLPQAVQRILEQPSLLRRHSSPPQPELARNGFAEVAR